MEKRRKSEKKAAKKGEESGQSSIKLVSKGMNELPVIWKKRPEFLTSRLKRFFSKKKTYFSMTW